MTPKDEIAIGTHADWDLFHEQGLDTIVDPMVFRAADIYLRGMTGAQELSGRAPEELWGALSSDLGALATFIDQIILNDCLPLIDYGVTFDSNVGYDTPWIGDVINRELDEKVIHLVHVYGDVSAAARTEALAALPSRPNASPELAASVLRELGAFDYQWRPDLGALDHLTESELALARFVYGGLLFSALSQMSGSVHVLQPKRGRLSMALALGAPTAAFSYEQELAGELDRRIQANPEYRELGLGAIPSFLPYILRSFDPRGPVDLLRAAKALRRDKEVSEYRAWRRTIVRTWIEKGFVEDTYVKDVKRLLIGLRERLDVDGSVDVELGVGAGVGEKGIGINAGISVPVRTGRIWGWILEQLPGRRYLKLLRKLKLADQSYAHMDRHLKTVWSTA